MNLLERKMINSDAKEISLWSYPGPYKLYSFDGSHEIVAELLFGEYKAVYSDDQLFGYYCTGKSAQVPIKESVELYAALDAVDIGLGMKPCNTAEGLGREFVDFILSCVRKDYPSRITPLLSHNANAYLCLSITYLYHVWMVTSLFTNCFSCSSLKRPLQYYKKSP